MMRNAAATATTTKGTAAPCPRPSYRSYRATLTACSKALPPDAPGGSSSGIAVSGGGGAGGRRGDWRGSKEVLRMMWDDEAARVAKGDVAVPGKWAL